MTSEFYHEYCHHLGCVGFARQKGGRRLLLKGTLTRDFRPLSPCIKQLPQAPDTRVKAFLNMASYMQRKSTKLVAQRWHWHCCHMQSGVIDTAVICTAVSLTQLYNQLCQKFSQMILNTTVFLCGNMIRLHTATFKRNIYRKNIDTHRYANWPTLYL
jgi:hypothetical protein